MKDKITVISFAILLFSFFLGGIFDKDIDISTSERRKLAKFPTFSKESLLEGTFFDKVNTYALDQFPLREHFKQAKSFFTSTIYQKKENHGAYLIKDNIFALDYKINEKS